MPPYSATKRMTILSTACERAGPEGRDVRSLRVSSTHAFEESLSSRSEISSRGEWVGTTGFLGCEASLGFVDECDLVIGAYLDLGRGLCSLALLHGGCHCIPCRIFSDGRGSGNGGGWFSGLDNTGPTDNVVPARTQLLLFRGLFRSRYLSGGRNR